MEYLEPRWAMAAGDLDLTFSGDGRVTDDLGLVRDEEVNATAVQADGKILVAGLTKVVGGAQRDFMVARYNTDGTRDTTFGTGGYTVINMSGVNGSGVNVDDFINEIAIDPLGRILVVGSGQFPAVGGQTGLAMARLTSSGQLDTSFSGDGRHIQILQNVSNANINSVANAVKVQADGKIVVGGTTNVTSAPTHRDFAVARFNDDGTIDTTFGGGKGYVLTDFNSFASNPREDQLQEIVIQPDGRIIAVGNAEASNSGPSDFALARYNTDGTLDSTFGVGGKVTTNIDPVAFASQDLATSVALEADGDIVVGGHALIRPSSASTTQNRDFIIARYNSNGALDTNFGTTSVVPGTLRVNMGQAEDVGNSLLIQPQPDGKYVIFGQIGPTTGPVSFGLARVLQTGQLDTSFSGDGRVETTFPGAISPIGTDVAITPDGKIVAVGSVLTTGGNRDIAIARYDSGLVVQQATLAGAATSDEGSVYTLNLTTTAPNTTGWTINWGDTIEVIAGNPASVTHTYADGSANYTITATVHTTTGSFVANNSVNVAVNNVAPTLAISGATDVNEGDAYTLNLSSVDPGTDTITSWTINWGDSVEVVVGNPASVSHTYADGNANYTVTATATDEDGTYAANSTVNVAVHNIAPTLAISGASDVNEGSSYTLSLSSADPGDDTISSWTINWGDSIEVVTGNPASVTHTYADGSANYTISATATDEDGTYAAGNTVDVTVHNVAPTVTIAGAADVDEGAVYTLTLSSADPGDDTITSWTINWGDSIEVVTGNPASVTHTYADGGSSYTITATATDEDGTVAANTVDVTVNNVAPTLTISGAATVDEGSVYTLNLSSSDPGADTITSWTINWGDSVEVVTGNPASISHTYADGTASYSITATATDEDGTYNAGNSVDVTVQNVAPVLAIAGAAVVSEGSTYTLNLSASDPGNDSVTSWTINWGDSIEVITGDPASVTHTYADGDASYTITATATDEDGTYAAGNTVDVTVQNVAPTLAISGASTVDEGGVYTLNLSSSDPGADTITSWTINWGDSVEVVTGNPASITHTYADNGGYTITATATDEDGTYAAGTTVNVTVQNVAPVLAIAGAAVVSEGSSYTLSLSSSDPGADTITSWTINWGDAIEVVTGNPASVTHTYADGSASYTISATATDEDGTYAAGNTVDVTVQNVAPTLAISGAASANEGSSYTLNLSSSDPGADTITSWTINWGDGTQVVIGNPSSVTHTYADNGSYTITASATDEDGTHAAGNTVAVSVLNVAPVLAISGAASVNEGSSYTLNLSSSDPGTDTITSWTINWGDGTQVVTGNPSSVTHTYADNGSYTISATATDEDGTYAAANTVAVAVLNVAPTANAGGPYATFDDVPITLTGMATDPAGAADPLTYQWDLDGDGIFGETGSGATRGNEVGASVTYNPSGLPVSTQTVKLRVSDGDGGVTTVTTTVQVIGVGSALVGGVLYITGTNGNDIALITKIGSQIVVIASFNDDNPMYFNDSAVTEIQVRMRNGHDIVLTTANVTKNMTIDGGSGNDLLTGGGGRNVILGGTGNDVLYGAGGDDILLGGDGNDDLFGGSGNDVLVGGNGRDILDGGTGRDLLIGSQDEDLLRGGNDDDILIGGYTAHDNNVSALDAIMAVWGSSASFASRVATLSGVGGLLQAGVTVFDDDDNDLITGDAGRDLIFGDTYLWDGAIDLISLQSTQDVLIAVN